MESVSLVRPSPNDRMEPTQQPQQQQQQPSSGTTSDKSSMMPLPPPQPASPAPKKRSEEKAAAKPEAAEKVATAAAATPKKRSAEKAADKPEAAEPVATVAAAAAATKKRSAEKAADKPVAAEPAAAAAAAAAPKKLSAEKMDADAVSPAGRRFSQESNEDGTPVMCKHMKPQAAGTKQSKFDFALVTRKSRVAQLTALTVQMYVIHSEWDRIGNFHFLLLFVALATHGVNTFMRWRDHIDGRFDLKQIFRCSSNNLRVQYALAVLSGPLLALFTYWFLIPQKISLVNATLYSIAAFVKLIFACGCFIMEVMEVFKDELKPHIDYVKSFF